MTKTSVTLGERIRQLRQKKGVSQEELADKLGVSRQIISRWETDKVTPTTENIQNLATYFSVDASYFLDEEPVTAKRKNHRGLIIGIVILFALSLVLAIVSLLVYCFAPKADEASSVIRLSPITAIFILSLSLATLSVIALIVVIKKGRN